MKKKQKCKSNSFPGGFWQEAQSVHVWKMGFLAQKRNSSLEAFITSTETDAYFSLCC